MTLADFYKRIDFNGRFDREIGEWKIIDIHQIPDPVLEQNETDFYCCNGKKVYLLRLRSRSVNRNVVVQSPGISYLIAELEIKVIDDHLIKRVLDEFSQIL